VAAARVHAAQRAQQQHVPILPHRRRLQRRHRCRDLIPQRQTIAAFEMKDQRASRVRAQRACRSLPLSPWQHSAARKRPLCTYTLHLHLFAKVVCEQDVILQHNPPRRMRSQRALPKGNVAQKAAQLEGEMHATRGKGERGKELACSVSASSVRRRALA
jgi:hypothetical protein